MGPFAATQVVVLPFPFSDLGGRKRRPALLLAEVGRGDWIACQITSNPFSDPNAVQIDDADFETGSLSRVSFARPGKLFTANESIFTASAGTLKREIFEQVRARVLNLLTA